MSLGFSEQGDGIGAFGKGGMEQSGLNLHGVGKEVWGARGQSGRYLGPGEEAETSLSE